VRKVTIGVTTALLAIGLVACGSDSSSSKSTTTTKAASGASTAAEKLSGKVNDKGTKSIVGKDELELEADDFYFQPTYIKVTPGQKVKVEMENEGDATHTFTSSELGVDDQLSPGAKKTVTVTAPMTAGLAEFHCNFHSGMGMRGAFVVSG
jgi:plastocyanin